MITTSITAVDETARSILATASRVGVRYYKLGYFSYRDLGQWQQTIEQTRNHLQALAALGRQLGIRAGMHNHGGDTVGCDLWDSWEALKDVDIDRVGFFFDPAHATIEGAKTGWKLSFRRLAPRLFMVAFKDFVWEKTADGWKTRWVPLGQGMVRWPEFFSLLKTVSWPGPVSLHIEYDPGGSTKTQRYDRSLEAAARDLQFLRKHWQEAGLAGL
jgi:sugar phosphate isomerase/epimerase